MASDTEHAQQNESESGGVSDTTGAWTIAVSRCRRRRAAGNYGGGVSQPASREPRALKPNDAIGRTGVYKFVGAKVIPRRCTGQENLHRYGYRSEVAIRNPKAVDFQDEDTVLARCDGNALSEGAALMSARELADWLRSSGLLPRFSRRWELNTTIPMVWTTDGKVHIMSPLRRMVNRRHMLYMDGRHHFHSVDRSTGLKFAGPSWSSYRHLGVVPQQPEWSSYAREVANDSSLHPTLLESAVRGQPTSPYVAAAPKGAAPASSLSWIIDSGAGYDIVCKENVSSDNLTWNTLNTGLPLNTANGVVECNHSISLDIPRLGEKVDALILDTTPDVLSLGKLCIAGGFNFSWPAFSHAPTLVKPSGEVIELCVRGYIPFLDAEKISSKGCSREHITQ